MLGERCCRRYFSQKPSHKPCLCCALLNRAAASVPKVPKPTTPGPVEETVHERGLVTLTPKARDVLQVC